MTPLRILVLGGTSFVGRTLVTAAVDRGWSVTTFNRGRAPWMHPMAERIVGDRLDAADLARLRVGRWDVVVDTWAGAPRIVRESATVLAERVDRCLYISSRAVYASPTPAGMDESAPAVVASPDAEVGEYAENKRGGELAIEAAFGDRPVLARAGLILGPHEAPGRLPSWLLRAERGGEMLAPGSPDQPWQFIDVRDLAAWLLDAAVSGVSGPVNLVCRPTHCSTRGLLEAAVAVTGGRARLVWLPPAGIEAAGLHRWTELPGWIPPDPAYAGFLSTNAERAHATGLRCRPVAETVADTWAWFTSVGRPEAEGLGLDRSKERAILAETRL